MDKFTSLECAFGIPTKLMVLLENRYVLGAAGPLTAPDGRGGLYSDTQWYIWIIAWE